MSEMGEHERYVRAAWEYIVIYPVSRGYILRLGPDVKQFYGCKDEEAAFEAAFELTKARKDEILYAKIVHAHLEDDTEDGCGCPQGVREYLLTMVNERLAELTRGMVTPPQPEPAAKEGE